MSNVYSTPESYGLEQVFEADAGASYEFDKLVIWRKLSDKTLVMGTDSGCSCPCPFEDTDPKDLEVATPEAINQWFDGPDYSPRRNRLDVGLRQKALTILQERPMEDLDAKIRETEVELELLRTKKANRGKLTPVQQVAVAMHDFMCRVDHGESCSWMYEIDKFEVHDWSRTAHEDALRQAEAAVNAVGIDNAMAFMKAVKGAR